MRIEFIQAIIDIGLPFLLALASVLFILIGLGVTPKSFRLELGEDPKKRRSWFLVFGFLILSIGLLIALAPVFSNSRQLERNLAAANSKLMELRKFQSQFESLKNRVDDLRDDVVGRDNQIKSLKKALDAERQGRAQAEEDARSLLGQVSQLRNDLEAALADNDILKKKNSLDTTKIHESPDVQATQNADSKSAEKERAPLIDKTTVWKGRWTDRNGNAFDGVMTLTLDPEGVATGNIKWTLTGIPAHGRQNKLGLSAIEYIEGSFDLDDRVLSIRGYRLEDSHGITSLDRYRLMFSEDMEQFREEKYPFGFIGSRKR